MEENNNSNGDLSEEQKAWARQHIPNDPHVQEGDNNEEPKEEQVALIEVVEKECLKCSIKTIEEYNAPKTKLEYLEDSINKICPTCKTPYQLNPIEQNHEIVKRNLYTLEEWQTKLLEKYNQLKKTILDNLPPLWPAMELVLSVKSILYIKDCSLPMVMILLGAPSSLKTASLQLLRKTNDTLYSDTFTAKSFVSHNSALKEEQLRENDLLPRMKNKLFLAPAMASIFGKKDDELQEVLSIFTRIADGHGLESDSGACGRRGYSGEHMFVMVGVAVDIPRKVFKLRGYLGPKLYFFRLAKLIKNEDDLLKTLKEDSFHIKFERIEKALNDYLNFFRMGPMEFDKKSGLNKMQWDTERDSTNDNDYSLRVLVRCGTLLAHLRAVVTWEYSQGISEYAYATAIIEEPSRAIEQLRNLARGHALSQGRNHITKQDLSIPIKVVLSTASIERVNVFDLLIGYKGRLSTTRINDSLNLQSPTSLKTMRELKAVGLVEFVKKANENEEKEVQLKEEFSWFLSEEFQELRENFKPTDNREYLKKNKKYSQPQPDDDNDDDNITSDLLKENYPPPAQIDEVKPEDATYICKYCNKEQFSYCWDQHKKSCEGRMRGGKNL